MLKGAWGEQYKSVSGCKWIHVRVYECVYERERECLCVCVCVRTYVIVYGKTRHMGFFVKIKFDVYLISSSLELTYLQV